MDFFLLAQEAAPVVVQPAAPWYESPFIWSQIIVIVGMILAVVQRWLDRDKLDAVEKKVDSVKTRQAEIGKDLTEKLDANTEITQRIDEKTK